jgi:hypothetical protein
MFHSHGGAEPADLPAAASSRKPTPCSVRIASMQYSNAATTTRAAGGARREPMMDRTMTMRSARATPRSPPPSFPFFPSAPVFGLVLRMHMRSEDSPALLGSFQAPDAHLGAAIAAAPKFRLGNEVLLGGRSGLGARIICRAVHRP